MQKDNLTYRQALNYLLTGQGKYVYYAKGNDPTIECVEGKAINTYDTANRPWSCSCGCTGRPYWVVRQRKRRND